MHSFIVAKNPKLIKSFNFNIEDASETDSLKEYFKKKSTASISKKDFCQKYI
jgi:hypothetical protein